MRGFGPIQPSIPVELPTNASLDPSSHLSRSNFGPDAEFRVSHEPRERSRSRNTEASCRCARTVCVVSLTSGIAPRPGIDPVAARSHCGFPLTTESSQLRADAVSAEDADHCNQHPSQLADSGWETTSSSTRSAASQPPESPQSPAPAHSADRRAAPLPQRCVRRSRAAPGWD